PDAINNSWGSANPADDTFRPAIQALRAAGIAPVFAAGNPGAGAGSIGTPASIPEAITVGATDSSDTVAYFSGRGPSFYEGEQKPELSAPGVSVKSVVYSTYYDWWSGTSMAAPHVAGLVALMVSADLQDGYRDLNVDELERAMADTAVDLGSPGPDDDYGYGRIDAFNAVRWVLSAGDLRGTVRDAVFDIAVSRAGVTGTQAATGDTFTAPTNATGQYSVTVPAGMYDISVTAWGYNSAAFHNQPVFSGSLSLADFALTPIPRATLSGQVLSGTIPVSRATVYVAANPNAQTTAGADGTYSLLLPVGDHQLVVKAEGYHILTETVSVGPGGAAHSFTLLAAPTILLVNADTFDGWFYGWPVDNYFRWALDKHHYLYDEWRIQYLYFNDTQTMPDGNAGYGVPSATTLNQYDVVIWAHAGYSPSYIGADDELAAFLSGGGRLILSGQDIAARDYWTTYFKQYLHADLASYSAAGEGEAVSGRYFLDGHHLKLTNASLYGYPNGIWSFSPDAVAPLDGAATPILSYDNGSGAAALAIAPCDADYRVVYFALGYENIAARAANRDPAIAGVLRDSIAWAAGSDSLPEVLFTAGSAAQTGPPGSQVSYPAQLVNAQEITASFELVTGGNLWPTRILSGSTVITRTAALAPCQLQELTAQVDIPSAASAGQRDTVAITATRVAGGGQPSAGITLTTVAFPDWQFEPPMPNIRYRLGVTAPPGEPFVYAIGGGNRIYATATNRRFDACTGVWETLAPLPERRMNINAAAVNGAIYVAGGYTADGAFHDTTFAYNPAADTWAAVAPLPQPLSGVALAGAGGSLYAFGGGADTYSDKTYVYNPAADSWAEKAPLPGGPRAYAAAAELNGKIYVVGGWPALSTVEVYDPAGDTWATAAPMNSGRQSPGVTAGPDGYLYVSGGGNRCAGLHSAERYNPATDSWDPVPALHRNRAGPGSAGAAGR
ncbi:MAG: S8 family serine peptidase, partial [Anaerolineae bacterium]